MWKMSQNYIEKRLAVMEPRPHARILSIAAKMEDVVDLGGGDPDFDTPKHITNAAIRALKEGWTHYPPNQGLMVLREALTEYYEKYGVEYEPVESIVTAGSGLSLFVSVTGTVNPGEEIIVFEPYFMAYSNIIEYAGAKEVGVPLMEEEGYRLNLEALKEAVTSKTKMIILCTPNNPSGTIFTMGELEGVADLAKDSDLLILSDEVYNEFVWDGKEHISIASLPGMRERTIIINSFSKTFAMTGWRLGYILADKPISSMLSMMPIGYRTTTFVQQAAVEALKGPWKPVEKMKKAYLERRNFMAPRLDEILGISCHVPEGAFYLFPNISGLDVGCVDFCESLLKEKKILVRPGTAFGVTGEGHFRLPLIRSVDDLEEIADAIEAHTEKSG